MSSVSHPNSLKNLELGRWKPGVSGNPSGKARGFVAPSNFISGLLALNDDGTPKYREADLEAILADPDAAPALKLACRWIVTGLKSGERWVLGKDGKLKPGALDPTPLRALESLADRQEGKPAITVQISKTEPRKPDVVQNDMAQLLEDHPELLADMRTWPTLLSSLEAGGPLLERLRPLLEIHAPGLLERADAKVTKRRRQVVNCGGSSHVEALQSAAEVVDTEARVLPN